MPPASFKPSEKGCEPLGAYTLAKPILFCLSPETAHNLVFSVARLIQRCESVLRLLASRFIIRDKRLSQNLLGVTFSNPVGLAAGFDKNATLVNFTSALGFGFLEVGSVTNLPSSGNPKPRLFRLPADGALINRMGLGNNGPEALQLSLRSAKPIGPIGINVAKTHSQNILGKDAIEDMVSCYASIESLGDFVVINISCPNTADGKSFQEPDALRALLTGIAQKRQNTPLLVKVSPDLTESQLMSIFSCCADFQVDGFVIGNTSSQRSALKTIESEIEACGNGGLSGKPLFTRTLKRIQFAYQKLPTNTVLIAVGGISSAEDAYAMIRSGASLVELYTGLVYRGPGIVRSINKGLLRLLEADGFEHIADARGADVVSPSC